MKKLLSLVLFLALLTPLAAHAFRVAPVVGLNSHGASSPTFALNNTDPARGLGFVWGGLVDIDLVGPFFIQSGALFVNTKYTITQTGSERSFSGNQLQIPVLFRFSPLDIVSLGAGFYYAKTTGKLGCSGSGTLTCSTPELDYSAAGFKTSDLGLAVSLSSAWGLGPIALLWDARYLHGLSNQVENTAVAGALELKQSDFQLLFGMRFGF